MRPQQVCSRPHRPDSDVVTWREFNQGNVVLEVFRHNAGSYGYRLQAWVAWRNPANEIDSHGWLRRDPPVALVTQSIERAQQMADQSAWDMALNPCGDWQSDS